MIKVESESESQKARESEGGARTLDSGSALLVSFSGSRASIIIYLLLIAIPDLHGHIQKF